MTQPFVAVAGLRKVYPPRSTIASRLSGTAPPPFVAVDDASFSIPKGRTFALVGESGSGKSTIARMVVGLLGPSAGTVRIDGVSITDRAEAARRAALRRRIQMMFQDPYSSLNPRWRVDAIVAEPLRALKIVTGRAACDGRVAELLERVGLHGADGRKFPHEFSGGQRQRIAIARALATQAEFIVCDEPTSALDVSVQAQILNLMRDLQAQLGLTYLFISHNLAVVRYMADEIGVLRRGRLVETGPGAAIFDTPRHPYTRELIEAVPSAEVSGPAAARAFPDNRALERSAPHVSAL